MFIIEDCARTLVREKIGTGWHWTLTLPNGDHYEGSEPTITRAYQAQTEKFDELNK